MLQKPESERSERPKTFAISGQHVVRMAPNRFCLCGREYVATDWNADSGELICGGCHQTFFSLATS